MVPGSGTTARFWSVDRPRVRRSLVVVVLTFTLLGSIVTGSAHAGILSAAPSECFSGEADRDDIVAWAYDRGWWPEPVDLLCGDETNGIIHIDLDHRIAEDGSDDHTVPKCFDLVMTFGKERASPDGNQALEVALQDGRKAVVAWDVNTRKVLTMYTTGATSNDWEACADYWMW